MKIKILAPTGIVFEGDVSHVTFPGSLGSFAVYPHHAPIISSLKKGEIVCFGDDTKIFLIESGFVEVLDDNITVCVEQQKSNQ